MFLIIYDCIRKIERSVSGSDEKVATVVNGYCLAVRGSLTSDGRPPLDASGLKLHSSVNSDRRKP